MLQLQFGQLKRPFGEVKSLEDGQHHLVSEHKVMAKRVQRVIPLEEARVIYLERGVKDLRRQL